MTPNGNNSIKALIVDDEPEVVEFLAALMEGMGVTVISAFNGAAAWEQYMINSPDIVFCDIYMPRMNGLMLMNEIKKHNKNAPVVLFTNYSQFRHIADRSEFTPDFFLEKPLEPRFITELMLKLFPQLRK